MRRPGFIAAQARHATGPLGRLIAFVMARETRSDNLRAIDALALQQGDRVLDVGCGPGEALAAIAERTGTGHVVGVDPSELMADVAVRRNMALIKAERVRVAVGAVDVLPFADASFDKVLCAHVLYFWPDLDAALAEIARVTAPGGRIALVCRLASDPAAAAFPGGVYRFRDAAEIRRALIAAGYARVEEGRPKANAPMLFSAERAPMSPCRG